GGIDGLLHVTDLSWGRVNHPSEMFNVGDEITVKILKYDRDKERVSLGYKQLTPDPWTLVRQVYPIGARVTGKVVNLTDYGAFIELEAGVEGLIHVSEMSWSKRVKHPSKMLQMGQDLEALILDIDTENHRLSLGLKQLQPDTWEQFFTSHGIGDLVRGRIVRHAPFGVFVELDEGIEGLCHVSEISETDRQNVETRFALGEGA